MYQGNKKTTKELTADKQKTSVNSSTRQLRFSSFFKISLLSFASLYLAACGQMTASLAEVSKNLSSLAECDLDEVLSDRCTANTNQVVTKTLGFDIEPTSIIANGSGQFSVDIPLGFYDGTQKMTYSDVNLLAANIKNGIEILGITGTYTGSSAPVGCTTNGLNSVECTAAANSYVTTILGTAVAGTNGSLSVTIPQGFYSGSTLATMSDTHLVAANIRSSTSVFGVTGSLVEKYADCSEGSNASPCSTQANRFVTSTEGVNITTGWTNTLGTTSVSVDIPNGYYNNKSVNLTDSDLIAENIKSGIDIFGVLGTYVSSGGGGGAGDTFAENMASTMHRDSGVTQISVYAESVTNAGTAYTNGNYNNASAAAYRAIPKIGSSTTPGDDDGYQGVSVTKVDRSTAPILTDVTCGTDRGAEITIENLIADCEEKFGRCSNASYTTKATCIANSEAWTSEAMWDGAVKGNAGQGVWKLVTRSGNVVSDKGREVWRDERTKLLWSSKVSTGLNWCKANGSNFITNNPAAEDDPNNLCDKSSYQNTGVATVGPTNIGVKAVSACFEDNENYFTDGYDSTNSEIFPQGIDPRGKGNLRLNTAPAVAWRLPSVYDYKQADVNGIRFVLPDNSNPEWSASVKSDARSGGFLFDPSVGFYNFAGRTNPFSVRCVGR